MDAKYTLALPSHLTFRSISTRFLKCCRAKFPRIPFHRVILACEVTDGPCRRPRKVDWWFWTARIRKFRDWCLQLLHSNRPRITPRYVAQTPPLFATPGPSIDAIIEPKCERNRRHGAFSRFGIINHPLQSLFMVHTVPQVSEFIKERTYVEISGPKTLQAFFHK